MLQMTENDPTLSICSLSLVERCPGNMALLDSQFMELHALILHDWNWISSVSSKPSACSIPTTSDTQQVHACRMIACNSEQPRSGVGQVHLCLCLLIIKILCCWLSWHAQDCHHGQLQSWFCSSSSSSSAVKVSVPFPHACLCQGPLDLQSSQQIPVP